MALRRWVIMLETSMEGGVTSGKMEALGVGVAGVVEGMGTSGTNGVAGVGGTGSFDMGGGTG